MGRLGWSSAISRVGRQVRRKSKSPDESFDSVQARTSVVPLKWARAESDSAFSNQASAFPRTIGQAISRNFLMVWLWPTLNSISQADKCVGRVFRYIRKRGVKCDAVAVDVRNHRDAHLAIVPLRLRGVVNDLVCAGGIEEKTY